MQLYKKWYVRIMQCVIQELWILNSYTTACLTVDSILSYFRAIKVLPTIHDMCMCVCYVQGAG